jgi:polar amino acid transport system ATP-binding protein
MDISLRAVTKRYGAESALDGIDLRVAPPARALVLIGPSGGGKSTLLRVIGGLEVPDSGQVVVNGTSVGADPQSLLAHRRRNGFLFQAFNLFPHLSALENVALPLVEVHRVARPEAEAKARACLDRFGLESHAGKFPHQLSGGQQQRVGIARAIAHEPALLILDEPTSALDPEMTAEVLEVVRELAEGGQDILLSTHEMGFAKAVADRVVFLANGRAVEDGPPAGVFGNPADPAVQRFLARVMRYE